MLASAIVVAFSFKHVDVPVALAVYPLSIHIVGSRAGLGSAALLTFEAVAEALGTVEKLWRPAEAVAGTDR